MTAVATVKIDLLNCPNWVSCFSNGILSCYMRNLSVMQHPVILHFMCKIDGFYSCGVIMMALRGGLVNLGHHEGLGV